MSKVRPVTDPLAVHGNGTGAGVGMPNRKGFGTRIHNVTVKVRVILSGWIAAANALSADS
jgi:hypothetical protein